MLKPGCGGCIARHHNHLRTLIDQQSGKVERTVSQPLVRAPTVWAVAVVGVKDNVLSGQQPPDLGDYRKPAQSRVERAYGTECRYFREGIRLSRLLLSRRSHSMLYRRRVRLRLNGSCLLCTRSAILNI